MIAPDRNHLQSLTSLRGIAALAVVTFHAMSAGFGGAPGIGIELIPRRGYLAVDFFFILSGFVLAHVYSGELGRGLDARNIGHFLWARIARIYPVHLLATLLFLGWYGTSAAFSGSALALNLLLLQGPWVGFDTWNIVAWSMSVEWHAYLLFPLLCIVLCAARPAAAAVIAAILWAVIAFATASQHGTVAYAEHGLIVLARSLPEFAIGILVYRLYRSGWAQPLWRSGWLFVAPALAIIGLAALWPSDLAIISLLPPLLLAAAANEGRVQAFLTIRPLVFLGEISYSLYMVHVFCFLVIRGLAGQDGGFEQLDVTSRALAIGAGAVLSLVMAALVSRCIEYPARTALRRWFPPTSALAAQPVA